MTNPHITRSCTVLVALLLAGCATGRQIDKPLASAQELIPVARSTTAQAAAPTEPVAPRVEPVLVTGNDIMIATPSARGAISGKGEKVSLRFEKAPVEEVVHAVFGDLLGLDYAIVSPLAGEITVYTQRPIARDQVLDLVDSLLQANGLGIAQDAAGRYRIGKIDLVSGNIPPPSRPAALPAGAGSVIVPLQYISAAEMAEILRPVASDAAIVRVDTVRNLIMLAGSRNQIEGWLELVATFDVDFLKGLSVGLFPLVNVTATDIDATLRAMFGEQGVTTASGAGALAGGGGAAQATPQEGGALGGVIARGQNLGPLSGLVRILPIERLNALLIVTPRAHYLQQARVWIERLDRPGMLGSDTRLYVYPVQNGNAQHLANLLNALYGGGEGSASTTARQDSGVAPALGQVGSLGSARRSGGLNTTSGTGTLGSRSSVGSTVGSTVGQGGNAAAGSGPTLTRVDLAANIRVVADDRNNALLIYASGHDYRRLADALRQLDVSPVQVLIEASIVEVTLNDELRYGLQWYFKGGADGGGRTGIGQLTGNENGTIGPISPGFSYSIFSAEGQIRAVLNALADKSLLNVLSSPSVMVQDNRTAFIQVGDQQPIKSATTVSDSGNLTTESIQYKDTGVDLAVTPTVNAGDMVSMVINQSITDVGPVDEATGQRSFLQRQLSSQVAVRSGETIVLGGLIRDNKTNSRSGIPLLHDIPVVGNLFGATNVTTTRTELLVMITPRVVRSELDIREAGAEIRERMRGLRNLLDSGDVLGTLALPAAASAPQAAPVVQPIIQENTVE